MSVSVFVPSHITGFFSIENHENNLINGSCGAGFLLNKGVKTSIKHIDDDEPTIKINGKTDLFKEVIIREVLKILNIDDPVEINQKIDIPIGAGFGSSAASAIGVAIGLNKILDLGYSFEKAAQIAHIAEINLGSGLGDVISQTGQGFVTRTKPGAPGIGEITSIDQYEIFVGCKTFNKINTSSIIQDDNYKKIITKKGLESLNRFNKNPTIENFLKESYRFSNETKLITKNIQEASEILKNEDNILGSSMAMLGETLFAFSENKKSLKNSEIKDFKIYKINNEGITYD